MKLAQKIGATLLALWFINMIAGIVVAFWRGFTYGFHGQDPAWATEWLLISIAPIVLLVPVAIGFGIVELVKFWRS